MAAGQGRESIRLGADALAKCVQAVGSLLVTMVDTMGTIGRSLLKALEDFVIAISSMPDVQQIGRYVLSKHDISLSILELHSRNVMIKSSTILCLGLPCTWAKSSSILLQ